MDEVPLFPDQTQPLGWWIIRLERNELLELIGQSATRVFPIVQANLPDPLDDFFDDGGEYTATVKITVE